VCPLYTQQSVIILKQMEFLMDKAYLLGDRQPLSQDGQ